MERLQLANETLIFHLDNLAQAKNVNVEDDVNDRDGDIMEIDQCSPHYQIKPKVNEAEVTSNIKNMQ